MCIIICQAQTRDGISLCGASKLRVKYAGVMFLVVDHCGMQAPLAIQGQ